MCFAKLPLGKGVLFYIETFKILSYVKSELRHRGEITLPWYTANYNSNLQNACEFELWKMRKYEQINRKKNKIFDLKTLFSFLYILWFSWSWGRCQIQWLHIQYHSSLFYFSLWNTRPPRRGIHYYLYFKNTIIFTSILMSHLEIECPRNNTFAMIF